MANGADRAVPVTALPALGSGAATAFTAAGADAFGSNAAAASPKPGWAPGSSCSTPAATSLGTFEAVERDGSARLRLAGAGALSGVAS